VTGEVARVEDETGEVDKERQEQLAEDGVIVALPHEVNEDANLRLCKDLIVVRFCQRGQ